MPFVSIGVGEATSRTVFPATVTGGHNGGGEVLLRDFLTLLQSKSGDAATSVKRSVESHLIACAAEASRPTHTAVDMEDYRRKLNALPEGWSLPHALTEYPLIKPESAKGGRLLHL